MKAGASDSLMTFLSSCLLTVLLFAGRYILDQRDSQRPSVRIETAERTRRDSAEASAPKLQPVDDTILKSPWPELEDSPGTTTDTSAETPFDPVSVTAELPAESPPPKNTATAPADTYKVVAVIDGDTADVLVNNKPERLRFSGIDCPEKGQPFGNNAKEALSRLIGRKFVRVVVRDTDRYGRKIADLYIDDLWVNRWLVEQGLAWHYTAYSDDQNLAAAEKLAKQTGRGLWSDPRYVPPWNWRRLSKVERDAYR